METNQLTEEPTESASGRPPLADSVRLEKVARARVSQEEYRMLTEEADKNGLKLSQLIRLKLFEAPTQLPFMRQLPPDVKSALNQLERASNLLLHLKQKVRGDQLYETQNVNNLYEIRQIIHHCKEHTEEHFRNQSTFQLVKKSVDQLDQIIEELGQKKESDTFLGHLHSQLMQVTILLHSLIINPSQS